MQRQRQRAFAFVARRVSGGMDVLRCSLPALTRRATKPKPLPRFYPLPPRHPRLVRLHFFEGCWLHPSSAGFASGFATGQELADVGLLEGLRGQVELGPFALGKGGEVLRLVHDM